MRPFANFPPPWGEAIQLPHSCFPLKFRPALIRNLSESCGLSFLTPDIYFALLSCSFGLKMRLCVKVITRSWDFWRLNFSCSSPLARSFPTLSVAVMMMMGLGQADPVQSGEPFKIHQKFLILWADTKQPAQNGWAHTNVLQLHAHAREREREKRYLSHAR